MILFEKKSEIWVVLSNIAGKY